MYNTQFRLHFIVLLWGFTGIMGKLINLSALPLVFWRTIITITTIVLMLKAVEISLKVTKSQFIQYIGVGVVIGLHWALFFGAIKVSNVSVALSTLSTAALFTAIIEPFFYERKINIYEVVLSLIVIVCLWLIFRASPEYWLGILLGISCAFLSALMAVLNGVLQKKPNSKPRIIILYEMIGAFLVVAILMPFFTDSIDEILFQKSDFIWLLILGTVLTAYPMIESVKLMKYMSPYTLVLAVNMEPIYSITLAFIIFGESEKMSPIFYIAASVMILVIVLNEIIKIRLKKNNQPQNKRI